jgi:hypothetical protein
MLRLRAIQSSAMISARWRRAGTARLNVRRAICLAFARTACFDDFCRESPASLDPAGDGTCRTQVDKKGCPLPTGDHAGSMVSGCPQRRGKLYGVEERQGETIVRFNPLLTQRKPGGFHHLRDLFRLVLIGTLGPDSLVTFES